MQRQDRNSSIELLRLILMLMVVVVHFLGHNILIASEPITSSNVHFYTSNLLMSFVVCAVDCFVLISGWFTIKFSVTKLVTFLLPICFYQFIISCMYHPFGARISISPFEYWFVTPYVALMITSPILNKGLEIMKMRSMLTMLICLTLFFILPLKSMSGMFGKNFFVFVYIYCLGYFLKNHLSNKGSVFLYLGGYVLMAFLIFFETVYLETKGLYEGKKTLSYSYDNILIILESVFLFLFFAKFDLKSKWINKISASAFFVYIITENVNCWKNSSYSIYKLMNVSNWEHYTCYILLILCASVMVFILSLIVDFVRRLVFIKPMSFLTLKLDVIEKKVIGNNNC